MATKTGLVLSKTVPDEVRSLGKVDGTALLSVVVEALKVPGTLVNIYSYG